MEVPGHSLDRESRQAHTRVHTHTHTRTLSFWVHRFINWDFLERSPNPANPTATPRGSARLNLMSSPPTGPRPGRALDPRAGVPQLAGGRGLQRPPLFSILHSGSRLPLPPHRSPQPQGSQVPSPGPQRPARPPSSPPAQGAATSTGEAPDAAPRGHQLSQ